MYDASPCSVTTGNKISRVEDFLVAMLWHGRMWNFFSRATSKHYSETPTAIQAIWCFSEREDADRLSHLMAEAVEGERGSVWVEPLMDGSGFCAYLHLRAQVLEPVS